MVRLDSFLTVNEGFCYSMSIFFKKTQKKNVIKKNIGTCYTMFKEYNNIKITRKSGYAFYLDHGNSNI